MGIHVEPIRSAVAEKPCLVRLAVGPEIVHGLLRGDPLADEGDILGDELRHPGFQLSGVKIRSHDLDIQTLTHSAVHLGGDAGVNFWCGRKCKQ